MKNEASVTDWLNQAETLANEKHIDTKQTVEQHKMFFQRVNENAIHDLVTAAQDLKNCLPIESQVHLHFAFLANIIRIRCIITSYNISWMNIKL